MAATTEFLSACSAGSTSLVTDLLQKASDSHLLASTQDVTTGISPLMTAATAGHLDICKLLIEAGAPWNAVDRKGKCAGNYATDKEHWEVVNYLVEEGTRCEMILGASQRAMRNVATIGNAGQEDSGTNTCSTATTTKGPVEHEPCTKPDYLDRSVRYNADGTALLDDDDDAVMMEWERPLMDAHASIITSNGQRGKRVMNVGFGMGIVDTALQRYQPSLHIIIEAHPAVHKKMIQDGWDKKEGVRIEFGRWQDVVPKLIAEGIELDGIFYDTYGEHYTDMEDFHEQMVQLLAKPGGIYSFFNGLAPDNLFFHGVACQCVKLQLAKLGLDTEFAQCRIQLDENDWNGVRRKYWHGRETYYLPIATWNKEVHRSSGDSRTSRALETGEETKEEGPDSKKPKA